MTDLNSEQLNGKYKQAYEFAMNDHLQAKQDLDAAKQEIEELRVTLAECEAKLKAMNEHNDFLEDQLHIADIDRTRAIDQRAEAVAELKARHDEAVVRLDMIRKVLEKPPETLG